MADLIAGPDYPLNPLEAFVLGGAFLLHDLGLGLAAWPGGRAELQKGAGWQDALSARLRKQLERAHTQRSWPARRRRLRTRRSRSGCACFTRSELHNWRSPPGPIPREEPTTTSSTIRTCDWRSARYSGESLTVTGGRSNACRPSSERLSGRFTTARQAGPSIR